MARPKTEPFDPFGKPLAPGTREQSERLQAKNILESYFHDSDLLAEALQNATDAIDNRTLADPEAPRRIDIDFDPEGTWFSVADTGTGMPREALEIVFQPNVSLKSGPMAESVSRRWRGEKGVGLSFLLYACDQLRIVTCDGQHRYEVNISGINSWVRGKFSRRKVTGTLTTSDPDTYGSSKTYTIVEISKIDPTRFADDLFTLGEEELVWVLRTRTAVGNTSALFEGVGRVPDPDVVVSLKYRGDDFDEDDEPRPIPYRYATPEDLLARATTERLIPEVPVYDADELVGLSPRRMRARLRGSALRYVGRTVTGSGYEIFVYLFAMDGNAMASVLSLLEASDGAWSPEQWSGFFAATRNMPTGIQLRPGILPTRAYESRMFGLLQWDELTLDVGRKSLPGPTAGMFNAVIRAIWKTRLRSLVERITGTTKRSRAALLELDRAIRRAKDREDLDVELPLLKVPGKRSDVAALFHELLASDLAREPSERTLQSELRPLMTGVFHHDDTVVFRGQADGQKPLHVVFGLDLADIVAGFDADRADAQVTNLAVLWTLGADTSEETADIGIDELEDSDSSSDGATHLLHFEGLAGREDPLRVIVIDSLEEFSR